MARVRTDSVAQQLGQAFTLLGVLIVAGFATTSLAYGLTSGWIGPQLDRSRLAGRAESAAYAAMLGEESALRAYLLAHETALLEPYHRATIALAQANDDVVAYAGSFPDLASALVRTRIAEETWHERWANPVAEMPQDGVAPSLTKGGELSDAYRTEHVAFAAAIDRRTAALAQRERLANQVFLALELGGFMVLFFVAMRRRRALRDAIVKPLAALMRDIGRVRDGEIEATIERGGPREVREIGQGISDMVRTLAVAREAVASSGDLVRRHSTRLRQVLEASREFSDSLNLAYVVGAVRANTAAVGGYERVIVWLVNDEQTLLLDSAKLDDDPPAPDAAIEMGKGLAGRAAKSARITLEGSEGHVRFSDSDSESSCAMAIPLVVGAKVIGVLEARYARPEVVTSQAVEVLEMFASHAATAIEAARLNELTEARSQVDPLTQLFNRRRLEEDFEAECKRCLRYGRPLAFVMLDVDHFKAFNDTHGHPEADLALQGIAKVILSAMRSTDTAFRYGGEEFCILLRETSGKDGVVFAERLRRRVEQRFASGPHVGLTASFGVAEFSVDLPTPRELVAAADAAMYESKHGGRNCVMLSSVPPAVPSVGPEGGLDPRLSS